MSKIESDASEHYKDIFHELVDYKNFKLYLHNMVKQSTVMNEFKIVRVLKDPTANCCSLLFCCKYAYPVNLDDELVVQHVTSNTKLFWPD